MKIRQIIPSDNASLAKMIRDVFMEHNAPTEGTVFTDPTTDHLFELFGEKNSILWVAEENGQAIGCCGIYPTEGLPASCTELVKFCLPQTLRGKGIGRKLMEKSIASPLSLGYSEMYIESLPDFSQAVRIYEQQGFIKLDEPMGESGHPGCNIWMKKELKQHRAKDYFF